MIETPAHSPDASWVEGTVHYKFNEENLINEIKRYIDKTYDGHYSKNQFQSSEFIMDCGHGMGFFLGNVLKYTQRYGKKDGNNRADLLKIIHYGLLALNCHDANQKKGRLRKLPKSNQLEFNLTKELAPLMAPEGVDPNDIKADTEMMYYFAKGKRWEFNNEGDLVEWKGHNS